MLQRSRFYSPKNKYKNPKIIIKFYLSLRSFLLLTRSLATMERPDSADCCEAAEWETRAAAGTQLKALRPLALHTVILAPSVLRALPTATTTTCVRLPARSAFHQKPSQEGLLRVFLWQFDHYNTKLPLTADLWPFEANQIPQSLNLRILRKRRTAINQKLLRNRPG